MRDIFPPNNKRSIRNITPPGKEEDNKEDNSSDEKIRDFKITSSDKKENNKNFKKVSSGPKIKDPGKKRGRMIWWLSGSVIAVLVLLVLGYGISSQFAVAKIVIKPQELKNEIDTSITAYKSPSSEDLGFEIINVYLNEPRKTYIDTTGEEEVEEKASGIINIYNEFNSSEQILVENTRFESPEGYIYRIRETITVPGMDGSEPGKIQVRVFADEPGEEYNISGSETEFTIPGFEGSPRYDNFYAKSESSIEGGFSGTRKIIDDEDLEKAKNEMSKNLEDKLLSKVDMDIPEGFILLDDAYSIKKSFETNEENQDEIELILNAHLNGVVFKKEDLAEYLFRYFTEENSEVEIKNWNNMILKPLDEISEDKNEFSFNLSGNIHIFHKIDKESLTSDLAGVSRNNSEKIQEILKKYPIERKQNEYSPKIVLSPSWTLSLPSDPNRIEVELVR